MLQIFLVILKGSQGVDSKLIHAASCVVLNDSKHRNHRELKKTRVSVGAAALGGSLTYSRSAHRFILEWSDGFDTIFLKCIGVGLLNQAPTFLRCALRFEENHILQFTVNASRDT